MQSYSLGIYEKAMPDHLDLEQKLLCAQKFGFDFLELVIDQNEDRQKRLDWSKQERLSLQHFMFSNAITAMTLSISALRSYPLGSLDPAISGRGVELLKKGIDLAYDIGSRVILINAYDVFMEESNPETGMRFLMNLDLCTRWAAARGVIIGLENADRPFGDTIAKTAAIVREINSPYLKIYADIGNATNAAIGCNADPVADLASGMGQIVAVHLKDTMPGEYRFTRYGQGHVNFASCIGCLSEGGVGLYTAELFLSRERDWQDEMKLTHQFLRNFL